MQKIDSIRRVNVRNPALLVGLTGVFGLCDLRKKTLPKTLM